MASLTIRKLDDAIRDELRLRAARNGRSVEDEVRVILREAAQGQAACALPAAAAAEHPALVCGRRHAPAPRHPDHRRRHRRLQIARTDPPAEGAADRGPLRADQGRAAIRHAAVGQRAGA